MTATTRLVGAALLLTGAIQLAAGWTGPVPIAVLAAAALVPYGGMLLAARLRLPPALVAGGVLVLLAAVSFIASDGSLAAVRDAVPRLLTAPRPASATMELLLPGVLLATMVGLVVGIRATRPGGGRFAPLAGAAILYLGGALLSAGQADRYGLIAGLLVGCALVGWSVGARPTGRRAKPGGRVPSRALPGLAACAAAAALVAAVLPGGAGFDPGQVVPPPPLPLDARNPLPRLAAYAAEDRELFRHTAGEHRLHLVALSDFDGAAWQADASYRPLGAVPPAALPVAANRTEVGTEVTITALDGPWLPAPGTPTEVSLPGARVDPESGSLVHGGGPWSGLRYQVRALADTPSRFGVAIAGVPTAEQYLEVPRRPFLFAEYVQAIVAGASTPFDQAVLIESAVRGSRRLDQTAPAGSSYIRLETFLFGEPDVAGAQAGTSEQFATAFAVLARTAGLPTRVVVGFGPGQQQPDGTWLVRGRDALAWPEVYFTGQGWVTFNPTPNTQDQSDLGSDARNEVFERVNQNRSAPQSPSPAAASPPPSAPPPTPPTPSAEAAEPAPGGIDGDPSDVASLAGILVAGAFAGLVLARSLRRRRHRRSGPGGAWSEVLDLLVLLGRRPPGWHTATRVADDLAGLVPAPDPHPAQRVAACANHASFAPEGSPVDDPWPQLRRLRRAARRAVPWHRRLIWPVDPRPIWRR